MRIRFPLLAGLFVCLVIAYTPPPLCADDVVAPIRDSYEEGDFNHAEYLALKALQNVQMLSSQEILEIHKSGTS